MRLWSSRIFTEIVLLFVIIVFMYKINKKARDL